LLSATPSATSPKETPLFSELSLCLSGACLGKRIVSIYKWLQKRGVSAHRRCPPSWRSADGISALQERLAARKNASISFVGEFSLCLSRACLGERMAFLVVQNGIAKDARVFTCRTAKPSPPPTYATQHTAIRIRNDAPQASSSPSRPPPPPPPCFFAACSSSVQAATPFVPAHP
jgi:hypothetical protein